ncbi:hypothetical protein GCM10017044_08520 [Kordiimonas sediminis]|uniref:Uncharacterized protein n=1 Tax=Kordiimonas sediminis TaxID=1735581 RepID=A0A919ANI5_9PROT|nr:hypothetical protein GCM10017044_08520 [Kordiimonas sediminis]
MPLPYSILCLVLTLSAGGWAWYRDRNYQPGNPSLVSPSFVLTMATIISVVLIAQIFSQLTGITWDSPYMRR